MVDGSNPVFGWSASVAQADHAKDLAGITPAANGTNGQHGPANAWAFGDDGGYVYAPPAKSAYLLTGGGRDQNLDVGDDATDFSGAGGGGRRASGGGGLGGAKAGNARASKNAPSPNDGDTTAGLAIVAPAAEGRPPETGRPSPGSSFENYYAYAGPRPAAPGGNAAPQAAGKPAQVATSETLVQDLGAGISAPRPPVVAPEPAATPAPAQSSKMTAAGVATLSVDIPVKPPQEPGVAANTGLETTKRLADGTPNGQSAGKNKDGEGLLANRGKELQPEAETKFDPTKFVNAKYEHQDLPFAGQVVDNPMAGALGNGRAAEPPVQLADKDQKLAGATATVSGAALQVAQADIKLRDGTTTPEALIREARAAQAAGDFDQARDKFAEAVHADPSNAAAQHGLDEILTTDGRKPGAPTALASEQSEVDVRRQEISYREDIAIKEAKQAIADNKWDVADAAIQRAKLAANADRAVFNEQDLKKFDKDLESTRQALAQTQENVRLTKNQASQAPSIAQLEEEGARAKVERDHNIADLQKTADDLTKAGKTKEAAGVRDQIQQLQTAKTDEPKPVPAPTPTSPAPQAQGNAPAHVEAPHAIKPKIIRTGEMEFEVDSFESAVTTITKVVEEEGGYVSTTNSDKLPNGKVKGEVVLRVTPDHLDTLVLKLRGIGDLKTQNIRAQDITRQYTDTESRLRAAQITRDRFLELIKTGKGQIKDLVDAEKNLGVAQEKVEQLTGELNYYASQVALSTLTLTLAERDIRTPASASEMETVTMTVVTERVDEAAAKAKDAIAKAKGRIIASQQSQTDEGQSTATIKAQVPPEAAEEVIAKLKQLEGQLDHFDRQRSQTTSNGSAPVDSRSADPLKVKHEDVTIDLTLYNLAKLTPRRNTDLQLAAADVDETKHAIEEQVRSESGRIIDSRTEYPTPDQKRGMITFDVPAEKADALITSLKGLGEVLQISTVENAKGPGVTESKRRFNATILDMAGVQPRRQTTMTLVTATIDQTQTTLADQVKAAGGRVIVRKIEHPSADQSIGTLRFEIPSAKADAFLVAMKSAGEMQQVSSSDSNANQNVTDSKRGFTITLVDLANVMPKRLTTLTLVASTADAGEAVLVDQIRQAGGRVVGRTIDHPTPTTTERNLGFEVPTDKAETVLNAIRQAGEALQVMTSDNTGNQIMTDSKRGFQVKILDVADVMPRRVTSLTLVTNTVDTTEAALVDQIRQAGGRIIARKIDHPAPDKAAGAISFDVPTDKADAILAVIKQSGETLALTTSDNTGLPIITDAKRGFAINLRSLSTFRARETETVNLASANVRDAYNDLRTLVHGQAGRVLTEQLKENDASNSGGQLEFEISREALATVDRQMDKDGQVVARTSQRLPNGDDSIDSKVQVRLLIMPAEQLPPRQTSTLGVEVTDVQRAADDLGAAVLSAGGRQVENPAVNQNDNGQTSATLQFDLPLSQLQAMVDKVDLMGQRKNRQTTVDTHAPEGKLARAHLTVTFTSPATLSNPDDTILAGVRRGLVTSLKVLSTSMMLIIIGLCVVVPFGLVLWAVWKGFKWSRKTPVVAAPGAPA